MHVERRIADNLAHVQGRIAAAAQRSGRSSEEITLVAVTKYVSAEVAAAVVEAGCTVLAESRPQNLWSKAAELAGLPVHWHMIGHLQSNKIRRTLPLVAVIQSVDSTRLLAALDREAALAGRVLDVLLEVNVTPDSTKTGLAPGDLEPIVERAETWRHVSIRGLMGMAGLYGGDDAARCDFARVRALRDAIARNCPPHISLAELSMGMSGDFDIAIEEGATMVRVGSALFEGLDL